MTKNKNIHKVLFLFFLGVFLLTPFYVFAEESQESKEARLKAELEVIEKEIKAQQLILSAKQLEGSSIERDIAILNAKISEAQLKIKKHNLAIERLGKDIVVKSTVIAKIETDLEIGKRSLSQIIRRTNQLDDTSFPEVFLGTKNLSESLADAESFITIEDSLRDTFTEFRNSKKANEQEKVVLNEKRNQEIDTRVNVEAEQQKIKVAEAEKKRLLSLNKVEQAGYQKVITEKAKRAAEIRAALFSLRDAAAIPFGTALEYAKKISKSTGVRPAFLLAILTQESNLGANVGSCYLTNTLTGEGIRITTGAITPNIMKPTRDIAPFLKITEALGRDYTKTRVSCPFSVGYGGAMGPAQFIPSTWMLFQARIAGVLGVSNPDPWNPEHAFTASALYLADLGATAQTYTAERNAACRYYSGRPCSGPSNTFYGDQVLSKATVIQSNIDFLDAQ